MSTPEKSDPPSDRTPEEEYISDCPICGKFRGTAYDVQAHIAQDHRDIPSPPPPPELFQCRSCNAFFRAQHELVRHINDYHRVHKCNMCEEQFSDRDALSRHRTIKHNQYECPFCLNIYNTTIGLFLHVMAQYDDFHLSAGILCPICLGGRIFYSLQDFITHCQDAHSEVYPHQCRFCHQVFRTAEQLEEHLNFHRFGGSKRKHSELEDEKNEEATNLSTASTIAVCGSGSPEPSPPDTSRPSTSSVSVSVHRPDTPTATRPVSSTVNRSDSPTCIRPSTPPAGSSAATPPGASQPIGKKRKKSVELIECVDCGQSFSSRSLYSHDCQKNPNRFKCRICSQTFSNETVFHNHLISVHKCCPYCFLNFSSQYALEDHALKKHRVRL